MKINSGLLLAILVSGAAISPAMADSLYAALDIGQSKGRDICANNPAGVTGCQDTATMYRIAGGYQLTPMWGAEASYAEYGSSNIGTGLGTTGNWKANGFQVSGTGTFPIGNAFSIIGKLGIATTDFKVSASGLGASVGMNETTAKLAFGIGAKYDFTNKIAMRAQYEDLGTVGNAASTGTTKLTILSAGLVFKF
jgi:OmpA-OmpF porin, OOP family